MAISILSEGLRGVAARTKVCSADSSLTICAMTVVQLVAVGDAIDEREIAVAHGDPVDALHVAIVEIVALEAPCVEEDAAKLLARIGGDGPVREVDCGLWQAPWDRTRPRPLHRNRRCRNRRPCGPASSCGRAKSRSPSRRREPCRLRRPCWRCPGIAGPGVRRGRRWH